MAVYLWNLTEQSFVKMPVKSQKIGRVNFREQIVLEKIKFVTGVKKLRPVVSSTNLCSCGCVDSDTITTNFLRKTIC